MVPSLSPPVSRRALLGGVGVLLAGGVLTGCSTGRTSRRSAASALREVTVLTAFGQTAREAASVVAAARGEFADRGLAVRVEAGAGSEEAHKQLAAGSAQFAAVESTGALTRYGLAGRPGGDDSFQVLAAIHQRSLVAWVSYADQGNIRSPEDLHGARVGIAAATSGDVLWPAWAELAGIDASRVDVVATSPREQVGLLAAGQLDAIVQFTVSVPSVRQAGGGREVAVLPWSRLLIDLYGNFLIAQKSLIEEEPELVQAFVDAYLAGLEYAVGHPGEAAEMISETWPELDQESSTEELTLMGSYVLSEDGPVGHLDPARVTRAGAAVQAIGAVPGSSPIAHDHSHIAWQHVPGHQEEQ